MLRPCFLVVDREHASSISTRKLVIETAKVNVITAYSSMEAIETLRAFPAVSGAVLDAGLTDIPCGELVERLRALHPQLPIVVVGKRLCGDAVIYVDSYEPQRLLDALRDLEPEKFSTILERDRALTESQRPD